MVPPGLLNPPTDVFHVGLLVLLVVILIAGMVVCASVVGVCCLQLLEQRGSDTRTAGDSGRAEHCKWASPGDTRAHFSAIDNERSSRMAASTAHLALQVEPPPPTPPQPPPSYESLYPQQHQQQQQP